MARKGKKKSSSSNHDLSSKEDCTIAKDESMHGSLNSKTEIPHQFTILLDHKDIYCKLLKSANVCLLHTSIVKSFQAPRYFLVKGKNDFSLCHAFHLKDINRSTIVFRRGTNTFQHGELVTLHPYYKSVSRADSVTVVFNTQVTIDEDLKKQVLRILGSKRYFYAGMTINQNQCDITITNIVCKESDTICDINSLDISDQNSSTSFYTTTNISLNETNHRKLLSSTAHGKSRSFQFNQSSSQLNSMFSSLCLNDSEFEDSKNSSENCDLSNVSDIELLSETSMPEFFQLSYATSITVIGNSMELETRSLPSFSQIGGLMDELQCVKSLIDRFLNSEHSLFRILLLLGPPGTGKTLTLDAIRNEFEVHIEEILWYKLYLITPPEAERELRQIFLRASHRAPSIIIVDKFNYLCPKVKNLQDQHISRMMSRFIESNVDKKIIIVAASNDLEYDAEVLLSGETRLVEIKFRIPTTEEREDIFTKLLSTTQHNLTPEEIKQCILHSQGFTGRDLNCVLSEAISLRMMQAHRHKSSSENSDSEVVTFTDMKQALKYKKPSIVQSNMKIKEVRWGDIGGMKDVKEKLKDIVEGPLKYPEIYKRLGVTPSRGVLLFGPPGCSKTMIAKALATECDLNFISKNVSDIQNKYVGESEKAVRDLFLLAREKSPCIIFLDEIDALVAGRGSSTGSGVEDRIVNSFLQEMDGLEELRNVIIIAATNRPDRLDAAFVRNGRINHFIYIPLPDLEARKEILKLQMKNRTVADDFDYEHLALKMEGYSGAEIVNLCNEAAFQILEEDVDCKSSSYIFTMRYFENAMKSVVPRTPIELLDFYKDYNARFGSK